MCYSQLAELVLKRLSHFLYESYEMVNKFEVRVTDGNKSNKSSKEVIALVQQGESIPRGDIGAYLVGVFACQPLTEDGKYYDFEARGQWKQCCYKNQWKAALQGKDEFADKQKELILAGSDLLKSYHHGRGKEDGWGEIAIKQSHVLKLLESWKYERGNIFPDEIDADEVADIYEGAKQQVTVNAYERNLDARRQCIEHHKTSCVICTLSFESVYGKIAEGFIHVHHLRPLSEIGEEYKIDPVNDLRPVCPNCHAVLHLKRPPFSIEEVKEFIKQKRTTAKTGHNGNQDE